MSFDTLLLSLIVFLPAIGALLLTFFPRGADGLLKGVTLFLTFVVFLLTLVLAGRFNVASGEMQQTFNYPWIPAFDIDYFMGIDGISLSMILLTSFLFVISMWASWNIKKFVKAYCMLFLVLETGVLGVFASLDFILFYVFWEVMLLPMYFLIGVWGGPRREYAAIKFFLYTLLGGVLMLIAILMLYFNSDLVELARTQQALPEAQRFAWDGMHLSPGQSAAALAAAEQSAAEGAVAGAPQHTFNLLALMKMGQHTDLFSQNVLWGRNLQWWAFLLLFIGFAIKVPAFPVHTWLPDAHVEAPTPISMILAGILLKLGGYGIIRICYPICPEGGYDLAMFVCGIGIISMIYGALAAMAQKDFKRLVAYSSVSHMGYVLLGIGVWSAAAGMDYVSDYWQMGMNGAMFQMIAHGISSAGMFFLVGVLYDRVHHRNLDQFGGLFAKMPVYSGISLVIFFAALGLPGLCGFWGEVFVTLSVWNYSKLLAVFCASVVVLTAAYILWTVQRVYLGPEYKGPHPEALTPMTAREIGIAAPLVALAIWLGVSPWKPVLEYVSPSVNKTVIELADWTRREKPPVAPVAEAAAFATPPAADEALADAPR